MRPAIAKLLKELLKVVVAIMAVGTIGYFALPRLVCMETLERQKLADCDTTTLAFTMTCDHSPPYQFVLGIGSPHSQTNAFRGEIILKQSTRTVAKIPISSQDMQSCNWLAGLDAYILTWNRTNAGERVSELLHHGKTYDVIVNFAEGPPSDSSLWFTSIGRAKWW